MKIQKLRTTSTMLNADYLGAIGSTLCLIHCMATPFLFATSATALTTCSEISPTWWKMIDIVFLIITFVAVYYASKSTSLKWMPTALYFFWTFFTLLAINNFFQLIAIPHAIIYIPAICLSVLHLYNRNYCPCNSPKYSR